MTASEEKLSATWPSALWALNWCPSIGDDADGLLAAMLERVQAERAERRGLFGTVDADHAALFLELVVVEGMGADRLGHLPTGCSGSA